MLHTSEQLALRRTPFFCCLFNLRATELGVQYTSRRLKSKLGNVHTGRDVRVSSIAIEKQHRRLHHDAQEGCRGTKSSCSYNT